MKQRIKDYLADGIKPSVIASIVGCSPSYISQLLKDEDFMRDVREAVATNTKPPDEKLESKYEGLEHEIISQIHSQIGAADLKDLSRTLEVVVKARDIRYNRKNPSLPTPTIGVQVVNVTLPSHLLSYNPVVELNAQNEIIAIDDKRLAPMSAESVKNLFKVRKQAQGLITAQEI